MVSFPSYSRGELIADRWLHFVGVGVGLVAALALVGIAALRDSALLIVGVLPYVAGLLAMLGASALYNVAGPSPRKEIYRRLDHAAIFVMIAGTYTPFALTKIGGAWGLSLFVFVWTVAAAGVSLKLFLPRKLERLSIALYLLQGWTILVALGPLFSTVSLPAVILLGIGGVLYTVGVLFHLWRRLPYHNVIWHALVLGAAGCHYAAVLADVALGSRA